MVEDVDFYKDLILENLYSAINNYNDIKNNFSFIFFITEMHKSYVFLFICVLEINEGSNYKTVKKDKSKTPDFLDLAHKVHDEYLSYHGKNKENLILNFNKEMKFFNDLRGTYYHNPFKDKNNKNSFYFEFYKEKNADQFLKRELKNFTESLIANYIYIFCHFFDIEKPSFYFINFDTSILNGKKLKEKFNENKELKEIYNYYNFTKKESLINIDDYFGSEALLRKILIESKEENLEFYESYLNKDNKITGNGAYFIYYALRISNGFLEVNNTDDDMKNWIRKHYFPNNKNNGLLSKAYNINLIPYIKYIIDHFPKTKLVENKRKGISFFLKDIKEWEKDFKKYK